MRQSMQRRFYFLAEVLMPKQINWLNSQNVFLFPGKENDLFLQRNLIYDNETEGSLRE